MIAMARRRQPGFSLAELMIAVALGLLVTLVASALLVSSSAAYLEQGEALQLDDGGRYALEIIGRSIRQAGYVHRDGAAAPVMAEVSDNGYISGLDASRVSARSAGITDALSGGASGVMHGVINGSDVLALRYFGAGPGFHGDGSVQNCGGFGVGAASSEQERGWSIFYVAEDADGEAELRCKYRGENGWSAGAIVRGVDSFQVLYGIDTDVPPDGLANRYLNATAIDAIDMALPLVGADLASRDRDKNSKTSWKRVVSIKLALLLHGGRGSRPENVPLQFDLFGQAYSAAQGLDDRGVHIDEGALAPALRARARKLVEATIVLRNPSM
ncbi:MAG: type IV pilus assembly protein PilW [Janthinobacterium sp.]|jgi:type IV pilus assembly protein PilW